MSTVEEKEVVKARRGTVSILALDIRALTVVSSAQVRDWHLAIFTRLSARSFLVDR